MNGIVLTQQPLLSNHRHHRNDASILSGLIVDHEKSIPISLQIR